MGGLDEKLWTRIKSQRARTQRYTIKAWAENEAKYASSRAIITNLEEKNEWWQIKV